MDGGMLIEGRTNLLTANDAAFVFKADPMAGFKTTTTPSNPGGSYAERIFGATSTDRIVYTGTLGAELAGSSTGINSGDDFIQSHSSANCALYGHDGNDVLAGGFGDDYICGGTGNDLLIGRSGYDAFVFTGGSGSDSIDDFTSGEDMILVYGSQGQMAFDDRISQTWQGNDLVVTFDSTGDGLIDGTIIVLNQIALLTTTDLFFV